MHFSWIGGVTVVLILLPNLFWGLSKSKEVLEGANPRTPSWVILNILEGAGRIAVFVIPLVTGFSVKSAVDAFLAGGLLVALVIYYICWIQYFTGRRTLRSLAMPMSITPTIYFLLDGFLGRSAALTAAAVVFGSTHIYLSYHNSHDSEK